MKSRLSSFLPASVLLVLMSSAGAWAGAGSPMPPFRSYSVVDGLTQSDVNEIRQDNAGYLWFTTARGLNRYDGSEFYQYTIAHGLPTNDLTALYIDVDDAVWVGDATGGISVVRGNRVASVIKAIGEDRTPITDIEFVGDRMFAAARGAGILEIVAEESGYRLEAVGGKSAGANDLVVVDGDVWAVGNGGMYKLILHPEIELQLVSENIRLAHAAADGTLWVADLDGRIGTWADGVFELRATIDTQYVIVDLATRADGTVWAASYGNLFSFDGTQGGPLQHAAAVREYRGVSAVWRLFVDRENTLWFSGSSGLTRFQGDRFRHFKLRTGAVATTVWAISQDAGGRLWFGTETGILIQESDETLTPVGADYGIPAGAVRDIVRDAAGNMWIGVVGEGLFRLADGALQAEFIAGTEGRFILDVGVAPDGAVWYSTLESGVCRYTPATGALHSFPAFGDRGVYSLDISADGSVWYGADGVGLVRLVARANGEYEHQFFDAGTAANNSWYSQVRITGNQDAWVASDEGGLYRFESGRYTDFGSAFPWADQTVYLIEPLENGTLLVGGEQGLYQFVPGSPQIAHYGQFDGFIGVETNAHATFTDSDNFLWIGTVDGATRMDVSQPMPKFSEPVARITNIETAMNGLSIAKSATVKPDQRGVLVEFAAVSLSKPKAIEFSYKLVGVSDEWSDATSNRTVNYSAIAPGEYEFRVRARYRGSNWSQQYARHEFTVLPFLWQRTWFRASVALFILLAFWLTMNYRTRRISKLNSILRAEVAERTNSIESAKRNLQISNSRLSREIREREKANEARAEVETRFRRAFENVPIGMGLLDADGRLFDTNPALKEMFFQNSEEAPLAIVWSTIEENDRERLAALYEKLATSEIDYIDENISCVGASGKVMQVAVSLSAVRSETGELLYSVLQVQDVTESVRLTDQLEYLASYDDLTGLLNRRSYEKELERAWENSDEGNKPCHLLYMDLDQFKVVNDTSGHAAGDQLLRRVGEILLGAVRANDTVCRLGGDEFGIILRDCPADIAHKIAELIRTEIESLRFQWDAQTYRIGASIGGLQITPDSGGVNEIQRLADSACNSAKQAGRNRVHMVADVNDSARIHCGQIRWMQLLREAIPENRFEIYTQLMQPLADNAGEPERVDVILQLQDPDTGALILPSSFLPAAERYGMSIELDQWLVQNLLRILATRRANQSEPRQYWVNLSATSISDEHFAQFLTNEIEKAALPPGTLNFEIAETAAIKRIFETGKLMSKLREMGCRFALDDFGSALSTFDYLKKLPVDCLKIDGSFVRDLQRDRTDQIFVRSIIDIAHALHIKTVVAFVDNDELLKVVRILGADYAQGLAVGKPALLVENEGGIRSLSG